MAARNGKPFGEVTHVLFHPTEPKVVGFELQQPALAVVVARPPRYVRLDDIEFGAEGLAMKSGSDRVGSSAGKGFTWDDTVIWAGMPVVTRAGANAGFVASVSFEAAGGAVRSVALTGGVTADAAIGTRTVPGESVVGYDGEGSILIESVLRHAEWSGGAAKKAGETAAIVKVKAGQLAEKATDAYVAGAIAAANSPTGKRARRAMKSWLASAKDAMRADEDE